MPESTILIGDAREQLAALPESSVHCCVTSPPYWSLRDYGVAGQIGLESTPEEYIETMVEVFRAVRRVLRPDGTLWLNLGDSYCGGGRGGNPADSAFRKQATNVGSLVDPSPIPPGLKPKDLVCIPWRVARALQADGWWLRSGMPWVKRSPMPESGASTAANMKLVYDDEDEPVPCKNCDGKGCTHCWKGQALRGAALDRPASALEYVFLLTPSPRYYFDMEAVRQKGEGYGRSIERTDGRYDYFTEERKTGSRTHSHEGGRAFRNTDLFYASLKEPHGLICVGDELVGLDVVSEAFPGAFCTACQTFYADGGRRLRKHADDEGKQHSICRCGMWDRWISHFACFPRRLVEPMIKAGTSEKGCCPECGACWVRVVDKDRKATRPGHRVKFRTGKAYLNQKGPIDNSMVIGNRDAGRHVTETRTVGWKPGCECWAGHTCRARPRPCTVLDPFDGAGTTRLVAKQLGRRGIGIELNPEYAAMAEKRIANPEPLPEIVDAEGQEQFEFAEQGP